MIIQMWNQTNAKAHSDPPYALRHAAGRPEGSYATISEAAEAARGECMIVTREGWWLVAALVEDAGGETVYACENDHRFIKHLRSYADVYCPVCGTKEIGRCAEVMG